MSVPLAAVKSAAVAVPYAVAKSTVICCQLGLDRVMVNEAAVPSLTVTSLIVIEGMGSSSMIVPTPKGSAIVALCAFVRLT